MIEEYREPAGPGGDPDGAGKIHDAVPPGLRAEYQEVFTETERDLAREDTALRLLNRMAVLLERDQLLQTLSFPLGSLGRAVARYLDGQPEAFADRSRMEESLNECAWHVLPGLVEPRFVDEALRHILAALRRREDSLDRKALVTAVILCRLEQTPDELARNALWNFLFRRSLLELLELPGGEVDLPPEVRDTLRRIPLTALRPVPEAPPAAAESPEAALEQVVEDVFHGLEAGYLREHVGFSYMVRFPFALALLFPDPDDEASRKDPETEDRIMMATLESVSQEGAEMGVVDDMLRIYRKARQAATGERERYFYGALVTVLETYAPKENPLLPALYYEHYLHYLSRTSGSDSDAIRAIMERPLEVAPYERYMEVLRSRNETAAGARVEKIRDEVREWKEK